jgi:nucleotide-binding universal stress UspA family protein
VEFAASLAEQSKASLTLVHVVEWPWKEPPAPQFQELPPAQAEALSEYRSYATTMAEARLESVLPAAVCARIDLRCQVTHGKPYVEIMRLARAEKADLIVLGVHGRNPVDLVMFGSTANHIVRSATCPVLTVRR